VSRDIEKSSKN